MKDLFAKISALCVMLAALLGINLNNANAVIPPIHTNIHDSQAIIVNEITEQTPLFLYHANQLSDSENNLLTGHYSHYSHESHYSHGSHYSHYSSRW
jgi:hypothetical protein